MSYRVRDDSAADAASRIDRIVRYWNRRSQTYSNGVVTEFGSANYAEWRTILNSHIAQISMQNSKREHGAAELAALDLGCGPGFFCTLLSSLGCKVIGMDFSEKMIEQARTNVATYGVPERVSFRIGDASHTDFPNESFDLIVMRNVTWLMQDPLAAFKEWHRILRPGGRLVFFDANWYRYLVDEETDSERRCDQADPAKLGWADNTKATQDEEAECEAIARELPMTAKLRPKWDVRALKNAGFKEAQSDVNVWRKVWTPGEQSFYASSPLFMVAAQK